MSRPKRERSYSGAAWEPVQPGPSQVVPRRGYLLLRDPHGQKSTYRLSGTGISDVVEQKLRAR
ncbi:MAG: hypothetical protein U0263_00665 [Polyangiaceae bacterium]